VNATGYLAPQSQLNLYFATNAPQPVAEVGVALGQAVQAGQVLARLDDQELKLAVTEAEQALAAASLKLKAIQDPPRAEDIALAEASLRLARNQVYAASLGKTPEEVEQARLNLVMAQNALNQTYATMDRLVAQNQWAQKNALQSQADRQVEEAQIADQQYHAAQGKPPVGPIASAQAAVERAQADLDKLKGGPTAEDVRIAELQVSQAQAAVDIARHNAAGTQITAPFDGVVAAVNLHVGEPAAAALPAIVLADVSRFHLDVSVDEVDVARVAAGQPVTITLDALPNLTLAATVERIAPSATVNAGVVSYAVRLDLAQTEAALRGGMTATAAIVVAQADDVVLVPNWSVARDRNTGQTFVGLLRAGKIDDVPVVLGLRDELFSEVKQGVSAGDVVAVGTSQDKFQLIGGG
jgi:HlyD family secretion protein